MNLYLDDDSTSTVLVRMLRAARHDVVLPRDVGNDGAKDPKHFSEAIQRGRVVLTQNYDDFKLLSDLVAHSAGHHPGVVAIRKDNDPRRDMSPRAIVAAIGRLERSGLPIGDGFHILNQYR